MGYIGRYKTCIFLIFLHAEAQRRGERERLVYDLSKVIIFVIVGYGYECFNCEFKISDRYD